MFKSEKITNVSYLETASAKQNKNKTRDCSSGPTRDNKASYAGQTMVKMRTVPYDGETTLWSSSSSRKQIGLLLMTKTTLPDVTTLQDRLLIITHLNQCFPRLPFKVSHTRTH